MGEFDEFSESSKQKDLIGVVPELEEILNLWTILLQNICEVLKGIIIDEGILIRNAKGFRPSTHPSKLIWGVYSEPNGDCPIILSTNKTEAWLCCVS